MNTPKIYVVPALSVEEYRPHPEELAKQASRRMDTTHGLAAILRDARKGALLRMRSEIYFTTSFAGTTKIFNPMPSMRRENAAAALRSGSRRPPADRRSKLSPL